MSGKASNRKDIVDVIKKQKRDLKKSAGLARANASGVSTSSGVIASPKSQASSAGTSFTGGGDLNMHTYDIKDVDRLYFSTTAGSQDVLASTDTGIESVSSYNSGTNTYTSYGMKFQVPTGNILQFFIGTTEKINITTAITTIDDNVTTGGYVDVNNNYIQFDEMTPTSVGTVPADERRLFSDSTNNSELSIKKSDGSVVSLEASGTWVGTATSDLDMSNNTIADIERLDFATYAATPSTNGVLFYDGTDLQARVGGSTVNLTSGGGGSWVGTATSDLDMSTYNIEGLDQLIFSTASSSDSPPTWNTSDYGLEVEGGTSPTALDIRVPTGKFVNVKVAGGTEFTFKSNELDCLNNDICNVGTVFTDYIATSSGNANVRCYGDFDPSSTNAYDLGDATLMWRNLAIVNVSTSSITASLSLVSSGTTILGDTDADQILLYGDVDFKTNTTSSSAATGNREGYINIKIGGVTKKLYYYS